MLPTIQGLRLTRSGVLSFLVGPPAPPFIQPAGKVTFTAGTPGNEMRYVPGSTAPEDGNGNGVGVGEGVGTGVPIPLEPPIQTAPAPIKRMPTTAAVASCQVRFMVIVLHAAPKRR